MESDIKGFFLLQGLYKAVRTFSIICISSDPLTQKVFSISLRIITGNKISPVI